MKRDETVALQESKTARPILLNWLRGVAVGTLIIAITSPLFVRSYLPKVADAWRGVVTLKPGSTYRWTSEGYANSHIGKHGQVGSVPDNSVRENSSQALSEDRSAVTVALWGDSQAEGVCVWDDEKISNQASSMAAPAMTIEVLNLARSGDDCNDWLYQIQNTSHSKRFDQHVFLVVEWSDWYCQTREPGESRETADERMNRTLSVVPAFIVQSARNVLLSESNSLKQLRFRPGPIRPLANESTTRANHNDLRSDVHLDQIKKHLNRLAALTDRPCHFLYAPKTPRLIDGKIVTTDEEAGLFDQVKDEIERHRWSIIDLRPTMNDSVQSGSWPRGFHNGQFGVGHYNAVGNRLIAESLVDTVRRQAKLQSELEN